MGTPYFTLDIPAFRLAYPAFANDTAFPDDTLLRYFSTAGAYIANQNYGWLVDDARYLALTLMTAHLAALSVMIASGDTPGLMQGATIDKVSVTLTPPPVKTQFGWWLSLTPYGAQLYALLKLHSAGGFFVGGSATRAGLRGNAGFGW